MQSLHRRGKAELHVFAMLLCCRGCMFCDFPNNILLIFSIAGLVLSPGGRSQEPIFSSYLKPLTQQTPLIYSMVHTW